MNIGAEFIPSCLSGAYEALEADRAFVGCIVRDDHVVMLSSTATVPDLRRSEVARYTLPECPHKARHAFLLSGLKHIESEVFAS